MSQSQQNQDLSRGSANEEPEQFVVPPVLAPHWLNRDSNLDIRDISIDFISINCMSALYGCAETDTSLAYLGSCGGGKEARFTLKSPHAG